MVTEQPRQPKGVPTGGQFATTDRPEATGVALTASTTNDHPRGMDPAEARMRRRDRIAATTSDEATQLRIAQNGDTEQRELLQRNPNLTVGTLAWLVENWRFNPTHIQEFSEHPQMTDELRARIRAW